LDGAESEAALPSKMRTFWNNVALAFAGGLPWPRAADASPTAISESAATRILRDIEFISLPWQTLWSIYSYSLSLLTAQVAAPQQAAS